MGSSGVRPSDRVYRSRSRCDFLCSALETVFAKRTFLYRINGAARVTRELSTMTAEDPPRDDDSERADHLSDVDDGCGCTEIWEELAEARASD